MVNAATPAVTNACGGTVTAVAGAGALSLSGGTIPANGSCTITVVVTAAAAGSYVNAIAAKGLTTVFAYNDTAASATLGVKGPPTITKTSAAYSDPVNGTSNPKRQHRIIRGRYRNCRFRPSSAAEQHQRREPHVYLAGQSDR
jgi:hypothetical protein